MLNKLSHQVTFHISSPGEGGFLQGRRQIEAVFERHGGLRSDVWMLLRAGQGGVYCKRENIPLAFNPVPDLIPFPQQAEDAQRHLGLERATTDWIRLYQRRCGENGGTAWGSTWGMAAWQYPWTLVPIHES